MTSAESIANGISGTRQSACILAIFVWSHLGEATTGLNLLGMGLSLRLHVSHLGTSSSFQLVRDAVFVCASGGHYIC